MAHIEELELDGHRGGIIADVRRLVEKYRAIFDWDVLDIDQRRADELILTQECWSPGTRACWGRMEGIEFFSGSLVMR